MTAAPSSTSPSAGFTPVIHRSAMGTCAIAFPARPSDAQPTSGVSQALPPMVEQDLEALANALNALNALTNPANLVGNGYASQRVMLSDGLPLLLFRLLSAPQSSVGTLRLVVIGRGVHRLELSPISNDDLRALAQLIHETRLPPAQQIPLGFQASPGHSCGDSSGEIT